MIILISESFPYGGEPFLESEVKYGHDTVFFAMKSGDKEKNPEVAGPSFRLDKEIGVGKIFLAGLQAFFSPIFYQELANIMKEGFSFRKIKNTLNIFARGTAAYRYIKKKLEESGAEPESLVFYSYWMMAHALAGARLKKFFKGSSFVSRAHGYDLYKERSGIDYLPFRQLIFEEADLIAPISQNGADYLERNYPYSAEIELFRLGTEPAEKIPAKMAGEDFRLVSCSSIYSVKRVDLIIEILAILDRPISWIHFGDGPDLDKIKELAEEKLKGTMVDYHFPGHISNDKLRKWYSENYCDLFINVSSSEGIPVSIMEATSYGIPALATNVGGTSELIRERENGFLMDPDFEVAMAARKIRNYMDMSEEEKSRYRAKALTIWREDFWAEKNYRAWYKRLGQLSRIDSN